MSSRFLLWTFYSLSSALGSSAYVLPAIPKTTRSNAVISPNHRLHYQNDKTNNDADSVSSASSSSSSSSKRMLSLPVLGPIPNQGPLLIGADRMLSQLTPMQWQTLEEAIVQHHHQEQQQQQHTGSDNDNNNNNNNQLNDSVARIAAAPLIALMDEVTKTPLQHLGANARRGGRYATLAAVVGRSTRLYDAQQSTEKTAAFDLDWLRVTRQSTDAAAAAAVMKPMEQSIRLVGVGRAVLHDFFYRIPTSALSDNMDEDGYLVLQDENNENDGDDDYYHDSPVEALPQIVMAHFSLMTDTLQRMTTAKTTAADDYTFGVQHSSPIHALHKMAARANQIQRLHAERQGLVATLTAAHARLDHARAKAEQEDEDDDDLEDHDGLGMLWGSMVVDESSLAMEEEELGNAQKTLIDALLQAPFDTHAVPGVAVPSSLSLASMENYGLGYSASCMSSIPKLTQTWLDKLEPYYSPERRTSEECYYEILSFVALASLQACVPQVALGQALCQINTVDRLEQIVQHMMQHTRLLQTHVTNVRDELLACGEECTDLW